MKNTMIDRVDEIALVSHTLSDGSKVYDLILCDKVRIPCDSERTATALFLHLSELQEQGKVLSLES